MNEETTSRAVEFTHALRTHAARYQVELNEQSIASLLVYYEQVMKWNARLHLVAPCSPAQFATRHILESLCAVRFLPGGSRIADVGSGAGLPVIPCLLVRPDISATLIESSQKKAIFLREVLRQLDVNPRATVICERFEKTDAPHSDVITCRALDRFTEMFGQLVNWSRQAHTLLLFGGHTLCEEIEKAALRYRAELIPESEQRFLFIIER
jgi:16S rRNA (guanine527-N7)-methyltransferase